MQAALALEGMQGAWAHVTEDDQAEEARTALDSTFLSAQVRMESNGGEIFNLFITFI